MGRLEQKVRAFYNGIGYVRLTLCGLALEAETPDQAIDVELILGTQTAIVASMFACGLHP